MKAILSIYLNVIYAIDSFLDWIAVTIFSFHFICFALSLALVCALRLVISHEPYQHSNSIEFISRDFTIYEFIASQMIPIFIHLYHYQYISTAIVTAIY